MQTQTDSVQCEIIVHNRQGASDTHKGTAADCRAWFEATWDDPDNLSYVISEAGGGKEIERKGFATEDLDE